jgi:hypothetical protein
MSEERNKGLKEGIYIYSYHSLSIETEQAFLAGIIEWKNK